MTRYWDYEQGEVRALKPGEDPPISSLVEAFQNQSENPADAIVLRGYLGRSDILTRTVDYLERARRLMTEIAAPGTSKTLSKTVADGADAVRDEALSEVRAAAAAAGLTDEQAQDLTTFLQASPASITPEAVTQWLEDKASVTDEKEAKRLVDSIWATDVAVVNLLLEALRAIAPRAEAHVPWRIYLTPSLDTYVDFHRSSLLAYRREAKAERQDACTVWLRAFEDGGRLPIPYRVVQETILGPSFATWVGGEMVDDYFSGSSSGSAWGDQVYAGGKPWSGVRCGGKPWSGVRCAG